MDKIGVLNSRFSALKFSTQINTNYSTFHILLWTDQTEFILEVMSRTVERMTGSVFKRSSTFLMDESTVA